MKIVTFTPARDWKGRFKEWKESKTPSKKTIFKLVAVLMVIGSFALNYWSMKQIYNLRCKVEGEIVGYFTKDITCDEIATAKFEARDFGARLETKEAFAQERTDYEQ